MDTKTSNQRGNGKPMVSTREGVCGKSGQLIKKGDMVRYVPGTGLVLASALN